MDFSKMTDEQVYEIRRKRHACFSAIAEEYDSFEEFVKANDEWFAIMGIELFEEEKYIKLHIQLDFSEYETYHVILGANGKLTVSHVIGCEDMCANVLFNVFTENYADEEDIWTEY